MTAILVAGCASPTHGPAASDGPIDLTGKQGLVAIDLKADKVTSLSPTARFGWMSPSGALVVWLDDTLAILLDLSTGQREIVAVSPLLRLNDNATGLVLGQPNASWTQLRTGVVVGSTPIPAPPVADSRWTGASDDLTVFIAEYAAPNAGSACANDIYIHGTTNVRTQGCFVRVANDGRVGWTEVGGIRVRTTDGNITNITAPGGGDATKSAYVSSENPVFTADGIAYLKLTGGKDLVKTEIIGPDGTVLATAAGPARLTFQDISTDGNFLLVRVSAK